MNKWKIAFLLLAGAVLISFATLLYFITADVEQATEQPPLQIEGNILTVETTAKEFEAIAKQYLSEAMNQSPVPVELTVDDKIYLDSK